MRGLRSDQLLRRDYSVSSSVRQNITVMVWWMLSRAIGESVRERITTRRYSLLTSYVVVGGRVSASDTSCLARRWRKRIATWYSGSPPMRGPMKQGYIDLATGLHFKATLPVLETHVGW